MSSVFSIWDRLYGDGDAAPSIVAAGRGLQRDAMSTGNGLRISDRCARLLGGGIELRFHAERVVASLTMPLVALDGALALPAGLRVASLDDDDIVRAMDRQRFAKLGFEAHVRGDAEDEIVGFPAFVAALDPPPQVVLLDEYLEHPTRGGKLANGTELVPQLRRLGFAGKIVIKSANQSSGERARYERSGADGAVDKVLSDDAFARELAAILAGTASWRSQPIDAAVLGAVDADQAGERMSAFRERAGRMAEEGGRGRSVGGAAAEDASLAQAGHTERDAPAAVRPDALVGVQIEQ